MQYNHSFNEREHASQPSSRAFSLVQHNSLGSWDVFLSLFGLFSQLAHTPSIIALQDPPVYRGKLPSFQLYTSSSPPLLQIRSPGWHFMFLVHFYPRLHYFHVSSIGATLWRLTSLPPKSSLIPQ